MNRDDSPTFLTSLRIALVVAALVGCTDIVKAVPLPSRITEFAVPTAGGDPNGIAAGSDGNLWFTELFGNKIGRITPAGTITEFGVPTASSEPFAIAAGPDGNVWFTEYVANKVGRITPAGTITEFTVPTASSGPFAIAAGPDGNVWFTESSGNQIGRITPTGSITEFAVPTTNGDPLAITTGPDGNLWFTEFVGNKVGRITPTGTIAEFAIPTATSMPRMITAGPDGNLWFIEDTKNQIGRITPAGTITEFAIPTATSAPKEITAGPDGNLWFTEYQGNQIGRITPAGLVTEFPIPTASSLPWGITAGPDGNLWFAERADKIGRIAVPPAVVLQYTDGSVGGWYLGGASGNQVKSFAWISGPLQGWTPVDFVDLNRDGFPDVILRYSDGSLGVWYLGGARGNQFQSAALISGALQGWLPVGSADLNGDGYRDLLLQYTDGSIGVWYLGGAQGNQVQSFAWLSGPLAGWTVVGAADLNGDGHPDVLLQYLDGEIGVAYMAGSLGNQVQLFTLITGPLGGWKVVGLTDLNGDGHPDIVLRYTDGSLGVTYMTGSFGNQPQSFALIAGPLPGWQGLMPH